MATARTLKPIAMASVMVARASHMAFLLLVVDEKRTGVCPVPDGAWFCQVVTRPSRRLLDTEQFRGEIESSRSRIENVAKLLPTALASV
jgi:hypothetical protein